MNSRVREKEREREKKERKRKRESEDEKERKLGKKFVLNRFKIGKLILHQFIYVCLLDGWYCGGSV